MSSNKAVNILSLGWRSHWLAAELALRGSKVTLYDITDHAGWSHPEDIDGPFPVSFDQELPSSFVHLSIPEGAVKSLSEGFSISSPEGVCCFGCPNYKDVLENWKESFYGRAPEASSFWLDDFLKSFARSRFLPSQEWKSDDKPYLTNNEQFFRKSDRTTFRSSLKILEERSVQIVPIQTYNLESFLNEVRKDPAKWVVSLTVPELRILTHNEVPDLEESLGWHRKRFFFESSKLHSLPDWSVWTKSSFKSWKGLNQIIVVKGDQSDFLDLWTLLPVYNETAVKETEEKLFTFLEENFPYVEFKAQQSTNLEGALKTMFPIVTGTSLQNDLNFIWNSPREWGGYRLDLQFEYQNNLVGQLEGTGQA